MSSTSQTNDSLAAMPNEDQRFLLYFIFGTYFGPDLKGKTFHDSVLQRKAEGHPPYTPDELAGSVTGTAQLKKIYHYVLRKANRSLVVSSQLLDRFFNGSLPTLHGDDQTATIYPQFPDLFPLELHPRSSLKNYNFIASIVFIHNPGISYIRIDDIARFVSLTRLEDFFLDRHAAWLYDSVDNGGLYNVTVQEKGCQDRQFSITPPIKRASASGAAMADKVAPVGAKDGKASAPPTKEEMANTAAAIKNGAVLTGSATTGQVGPMVGLMDIGESEDSYLFRVCLPGVKTDEFSCQLKTDGEVLIKGVTTTGEKTVTRFGITFEMISHNLCPPCHFSIRYQLPGPIEPLQSVGNFGNGIFEGIVKKKRPI